VLVIEKDLFVVGGGLDTIILFALRQEKTRIGSATKVS
jgi:hypothetical protein